MAEQNKQPPWQEDLNSNLTLPHECWVPEQVSSPYLWKIPHLYPLDSGPSNKVCEGHGPGLVRTQVFNSPDFFSSPQVTKDGKFCSGKKEYSLKIFYI